MSVVEMAGVGHKLVHRAVGEDGISGKCGSVPVIVGGVCEEVHKGIQHSLAGVGAGAEDKGLGGDSQLSVVVHQRAAVGVRAGGQEDADDFRHSMPRRQPQRGDAVGANVVCVRALFQQQQDGGQNCVGVGRRVGEAVGQAVSAQIQQRQQCGGNDVVRADAFSILRNAAEFPPAKRGGGAEFADGPSVGVCHCDGKGRVQIAALRKARAGKDDSRRGVVCGGKGPSAVFQRRHFCRVRKRHGKNIAAKVAGGEG